MPIGQKRLIAAACAVSTVTVASPTFAHHPGGGGNATEAGPIFTIPASTLDEGQLAVGVMFEYVNLRTLSDGVLIKAAVTGK